MIETKFKQTEIGLIPEDWEVKTLGELSYVTSGGTPSTENSSYWGGDIPWMNSGELNLKQVNAVEGRITELGLKQSSTRMIPPYCVLIGLAGQGKTRGTAAYNTIPLCINQSIGAVLPNNSYNTMYMYYYIDSQYQNLRTLSSGDGGRGGLTKQLLNDFSVPLPPLDEQEKIAKALSDVDVLISDLDALIAKKRDIKQGIMQQLFTGNTRLGKYSESWECKKMGEMGVTFSGLTGKTKEDFGRGNSKYVTFLNVLNNPILNPSMFEEVVIQDGEHQNTCHKGDLFFNTSSETPEEVGVCSMLDVEVESLYLNSFCFGFRLTDPNISPKYLAYYFRSNEGRKLMTVLAQGVTRYNLSKSAFNNAQIMMPPSLAEQEEIAEFFESIDREISAIELKKAKYESIKQGMMQELLTGKIRLV